LKLDAVEAALHILAAIDRFNREHGAPAIILRIGAHCGPTLAVTLNVNLDYLGQPVNVAARVQSLADAGEICISESLYTAPGVGETLASHEASLPGVEGRACIYRVTI
jgi:class 3 adenylate cyclase